MTCKTQNYRRCVMFMIFCTAGISIFALSKKFPSKLFLHDGIYRNYDQKAPTLAKNITRTLTVSKLQMQDEGGTFPDVRNLLKLPIRETTKFATMKDISKPAQTYTVSKLTMQDKRNIFRDVRKLLKVPAAETAKFTTMKVDSRKPTTNFTVSKLKMQDERSTFRDVGNLFKVPITERTKFTTMKVDTSKPVPHSSVSSLLQSFSPPIVLPKDISNAHITVGKTKSYSNKTLSGKSIAELVPKNQPTLQTPVYLCVDFNGRLGNLMFEFASLLGIARQHGMTPAIPKDSYLRNIFNVNVNDIDKDIASGFSHVGQKRDCAFDPISADFGSNLTLSGYFQSWRYFSHVFSELRKQFTFKDDIVKRARLAIETSINSQHPHFSRENITFIGVHVRRGDFLEPHMIQFGYAVGSKDYLFRAMEHFLNKYKAVMFIVCSNDMAWAKEAIPDENATFITGQEAEVDMAILSLCNHTIMTVGSYGWWSAWLAGGTTIYQIQQTIPGTDLDKRFDLNDYMLPEWIGLNETGAA